MSDDRPFLGILLMIAFCLMVPVSDVIAKVLSTRFSLGQIISIRFGIMASVLVPVLVAMSGIAALNLSRHVWRLVAVRTVLHLLGTVLFIAALRHLPIADAIAIAFIMPFLMLLAGKYVLDEEVGSRRLIACAIGFVGTLMVIQPAFSAG